MTPLTSLEKLKTQRDALKRRFIMSAYNGGLSGRVLDIIVGGRKKSKDLEFKEQIEKARNYYQTTTDLDNQKRLLDKTQGDLVEELFTDYTEIDDEKCLPIIESLYKIPNTDQYRKPSSFDNLKKALVSLGYSKSLKRLDELLSLAEIKPSKAPRQDVFENITSTTSISSSSSSTSSETFTKPLSSAYGHSAPSSFSISQEDKKSKEQDIDFALKILNGSSLSMPQKRDYKTKLEAYKTHLKEYGATSLTREENLNLTEILKSVNGTSQQISVSHS